MTQINFFTAIDYGDQQKTNSQAFLEAVDSYFHLSGKKACVIKSRAENELPNVVLSDKASSTIATVLKVASYITIVFPLFMLLVKVILRASHRFHLIDPRQELEVGIHISPTTVAKIQRLMNKILQGEADKDIEWIWKANNYVFRIKGLAHVVFKLPKGANNMDRRFENIVKAKEICLVHNLDQLIVPHATRINVQCNHIGYTLLAEQHLKINPAESAQEELYHTCGENLNEPIRQLTTFITQSGFSDVEWRNVPVIGSSRGSSKRQIALIDLEEMDGAQTGIVGSQNAFKPRRGLINCVSEEQIKIVLDEVQKNGIHLDDEAIALAKQKRSKELENDEKLRTFYEDHGIVRGDELIKVNLDDLGLDLEEKGKYSEPTGTIEGKITWIDRIVTMRTVAERMIAEINNGISVEAPLASVKGIRKIVLNTNGLGLSLYKYLGRASLAMDNENRDKLWINRIIQALVNKGHLFQLIQDNGVEYHIQA